MKLPHFFLCCKSTDSVSSHKTGLDSFGHNWVKKTACILLCYSLIHAVLKVYHPYFTPSGAVLSDSEWVRNIPFFFSCGSFLQILYHLYPIECQLVRLFFDFPF